MFLRSIEVNSEFEAEEVKLSGKPFANSFCERLAALQPPYHVKVFLSRDPLGIVGAKPKALV